MNKEALLAYYAAVLTPRLHSVGELIAITQKSLVVTPYPPASSPGSPPHRRTGNLHDNITHGEVELRGLSLVIENFVADDLVPYAKFLEFGTHKMSARPFFETGYEMARPLIPAILAGGKL